METLVVFGIGIIAVVYWLVEKARHVGVITSPKVAYFAPGSIWFVLVALWAVAQKPMPPLYVLVALWLGGWVATMLFKSGVKDNERKDGEAPAPPQE